MKFVIILEKSGVSLLVDQDDLFSQLEHLDQAKERWIVVKA